MDMDVYDKYLSDAIITLAVYDLAHIKGSNSRFRTLALRWRAKYGIMGFIGDFLLSFVPDIQIIKFLDRITKERVQTFQKIIGLENHKTVEKTDEILETIYKKGIVKLDFVVHEEDIAEINKFLDVQPQYPHHVMTSHLHKAANVEEVRQTPEPKTSFAMESVVKCPHVLEIINNPLLLSLAQKKLGCVPTVFQVNIFNNLKPASDDQKIMLDLDVFHRDVESINSMTAFMLLSDVDDPKDGAHVHISGTHIHENRSTKTRIFQNLFSYLRYKMSPKKFNKGSFNKTSFYGRQAASATLQSIPDEKFNIVTGKAGTIFVCDSQGIHMGAFPVQKDRRLLWIRYGYIEGSFYDQIILKNLHEKMHPESYKCVTQTKTHCYTNRMFLRGSANFPDFSEGINKLRSLST